MKKHKWHCATVLLMLLGAPFAAMAESLEQRANTDYGRRAFQHTLPYLDEAAERLGEHEELPRRKWFGKDQKSNAIAINKLLDEAMDALGVSEASRIRQEIRDREERIENATARIADYREKQITAPTNDTVDTFEQYNPFHVTKEEYAKRIEKAQEEIEEARYDIDELRAAFTESLRSIGLNITEETAESLLATVSGDDFISLCVIFDNLKIITLQLQGLVDKTGEEPAMARRYYGMYVIIAKILDRAQTQYIETLRDVHIPMLKDFIAQARENIADAKRLIRSDGGDRLALESNIDANEITIEAAGFYIEYLAEMIETIEEQHKETRRVLATAMNTYRTVDVSVNVGELITSGSKSLERLMQLEMPELRAFENDALRREYRRLTEKMRDAT